MSVSLNTQTPLSYNEWLAKQTLLVSTTARIKYVEYLNDWYRNQGIKKSSNINTLKNDYVQLIKDLSFLFGKGEKDQFLAEIDFKNDEELVFSIPFFAKKLKEIVTILSKKREAIKDAKSKYNLIGSNVGLEKLLQEYILRGFTKSEYGMTQVPMTEISSLVPNLSDIKDNFYIEIEELHDPNTYFDSDPSVDISEYVNIDDLKNEIPFDGLNEDQLKSLLSTRFLPRIARTPLSYLFNSYLQEEQIIDTTVSLSSLSALIDNQINASIKYLSEPRYGLTAIRLKDVYLPDQQITLNLPQGNSWFLWPSGDRLMNDLEFNNIYQPIKLNDSNLLNSGATAGSSIFLSDLIFTEKNGVPEGAWLHGENPILVEDTLKIKFNKISHRDFVYPFVGFTVTSKGNNFLNYSINDNIFEKFNLFDSEKKKELLTAYYTSNLPNSGSHLIYLNDSKLIDQGAFPGKFPDEADTITSKYKTNFLPKLYTDETDGVLEEAFLYKFDRTDLLVKQGLTNIQWPIQVFDESNTPTSITLKHDTCLPINLSEIDVSKNMTGAVAGLDFESSDVIYKLSNESEEPVEAAWLAAQSIHQLDLNNQSIEIYKESAKKCAVYSEGAIQPNLSLKINPSEKISFIWNDVDTPANKVFKFVKHSSNCLYGKNKHDYYENQDYRNPTPLFFKDYWSECSCKSVNFSPVGHTGENFTDFNAMCDFIFADPDAVGADFALMNWTDTRNLNYRKSPQFAYYNLFKDQNDKNVGWGDGYWRTGTNEPFILKTGRRYTYCRTSFRKNKTSPSQSPYMIIKYPYKNIKGFLKTTEKTNLIIAIDVSRSQQLDLSYVKRFSSDICKKILSDGNLNFQISVITFGTEASTITFLTKEKDILEFFIDSIRFPTTLEKYKTNILEALKMCDFILNTNTLSKNTNDVNTICNDLNYVIQNPYFTSQYTNIPFENAKNKVLFITNGTETINRELALPYAEEMKEKGVDFFVADIGLRDPNYSISKELASNWSQYYDLERYLNSGDGDVESFADYISYRLNNQTPIKPCWNKAVRGADGAWVGTNQASDMILRPGDYISYVHRNSVDYTSLTNEIMFSTPSISFSIDVKLDGWDYENCYSSISAIGLDYGARPFWAKVYTDINFEKNFVKETSKSGGNVRFAEGYVPLYQPDISKMVLGTGDFLRYKRVGTTDFTWQQNLTFNVFLTSNTWKKIKISKEHSNIQKLLNKNNLEIIGEATDEPSDLTLESYSSFNPAYYNYFARNEFSYTQDLFYRNRCTETFVVYNTALEITPLEPYANLLNTHYPTVATVSFPSKSKSSKELGEYLLPENLGVTTYRGRGYNVSINNDSFTDMDSTSAERLFLDVKKYGPRHRGLTKKDQLTPVKVDSIDNSWIYEPYGRGDRSGVLTDVKENQKFTPYQTSFEAENENHYGISRQNDIFQFWSPPIPPIWNDQEKFPLTFRKEVLPKSYDERKDLLLVDAGMMKNWRTDIFGNHYGLFKHIIPSSIEGLSVWHKSTQGTLSSITSPQATDSGATIIRWLDISGNGYHLNSYNSSLSSSFAYQTTSPILSTNVINKKPALYFDGTASMHVNYNLINQKEITIYLIGKFLDTGTEFAATNYQPILSISLSSARENLSAQYFDNETFSIFQKYGKNAISFGDPNSESLSPELSGNPTIFDYSKNYFSEIEIADNKFKSFEFLFDNGFATSNINKLYYLNTEDLGKTISHNALYTTTGINETGGLWIGSYGGGQYPTKCLISEIIIFNRALTNRERIDIQNYINEEYNLY